MEEQAKYTTHDNLTEEIITVLSMPVIWPQHRHSGIYFLLDDDEIVYVGQSKNIQARFENHTKSNKIFNRWFYIFCDIEDLNKTEAYYILMLRPKYNIAIPKEDQHE